MRALQEHRVLIVVYVFASLLASVPKYYATPQLNYHGFPVSGYNNYVIFKNAGQHLVEGDKNLYRFWPKEQGDQFKYSPVFAAAMWPFSKLPDLVSLCLWNLIGSFCLLWALHALPLAPRLTALAGWLVLVDHFTSMQNTQSNSLVAALMILTFVNWQYDRLIAGGITIGMSFYLKIVGVAAALLWFVYPNKLRSLLWCVVATWMIGFLPLLLTSSQNAHEQFVNWYVQLFGEYSSSEGISVMGLLHAWFGLTGHNLITAVIGAGILFSPLMNVRRYADLQYRLGLLASAMIWVVIFNHRAESPTFVIATSGVVVWFVSRPISRSSLCLTLLTVLISGFSSTDLVPHWIQDNLLDPYHVKVVPGLLVWLKLQAELWSPAPIIDTAANVSVKFPVEYIRSKAA